MEDQELREMLKSMGNISDEDMEKIGPEHLQRLWKMAENSAKYRLVFEVAKAKNCLLGVREGQKIVISNGAEIDTKASDCPMCMGLVGPLLPSLLVFYDRCVNGNLSDPMPEGVRCMDPGLECPQAKGLGSVTVLPRIEPVG